MSLSCIFLGKKAQLQDKFNWLEAEIPETAGFPVKEQGLLKR